MKRKLFDSLNEKQQRLYLGELAAEYGKGGITKVAAEYGASRERGCQRDARVQRRGKLPAGRLSNSSTPCID